MNRVVFKLTKIPDLSLSKYNAYETSTQDELLKKQLLFIKQLHSLCIFYQIDAHLLYCFDYNEGIAKGKRLSCYLYFNIDENKNIEIIRTFVEKSIVGSYFTFELLTADEELNKLCFETCSYLTKEIIKIPLKRKLGDDGQENSGVGIREWVPNDSGRIYNLLKVLEQLTYAMKQNGGNFNAYRIDLFPVSSEKIIKNLNFVINYYHKLVYASKSGKDHAAEILLNLLLDLNKKFAKNLIFKTNIVALSNSVDVTNIMMNYVGNEANEEGTFHIKNCLLNDSKGSVYWHDDSIICDYLTFDEDLDSNSCFDTSSVSDEVNVNSVQEYQSIFTANELSPIFSLPVLYPAESIEFLKESDPVFDDDGSQYIHLGETDKGYNVKIPLDEFTKHAFISGVPGSGKTYTMFHILTELWEKYQIPFIVFEPAKKEYRELFNVNNQVFKNINFFSPSFKTRFGLHINPFEFPIGVTLDEHLSNLMMVFKGAFHLPEPGPQLLEECLLKIYENLGWREHTTNEGLLMYPTIDDLYLCFEDAISAYKYDKSIKGNLEAILKVRIGSLRRRVGGDVYNVSHSTIAPEKWIERPIILELEHLGRDRANFMVLLICALIRETLSVKELIRKKERVNSEVMTTKLKHLIFIEEAHNLIGKRKENLEENVDPKVAATNFIVDMIAEVRNLGEGLVIADQLPSVMAPEVLKNTSLKIAHRLTAKDDRESIGSSMAATSDQIDEQLKLTAGEAFVFYDQRGLEKSFKMKITKWNPRVENSYAKDDNELFEDLRDSDYYKLNIVANCSIRDKKFESQLKKLYDAELKIIIRENYFKQSGTQEAFKLLICLYSKLYKMYIGFIGMQDIFVKQLLDIRLVHDLFANTKYKLLKKILSFISELEKANVSMEVLREVGAFIKLRMNEFKNDEFIYANENNKNKLMLVANKLDEKIQDLVATVNK